MKNCTRPRILALAITGGLVATTVAQPAFYLMGNLGEGLVLAGDRAVA